MTATDAILRELDQEAATTARVLDRVPETQLTWKPHEKSMSLGQLAMHIAGTPGFIAQIAAVDTFQMDPGAFERLPEATSGKEIMDALAASVAQAKQFLTGLSAEQMAATWRLMAGTKEIMAMPRASLIRMIMLNHWYHHRGQMSVYLRLLNVQVPSIYGPSADENPMARQASA